MIKFEDAYHKLGIRCCMWEAKVRNLYNEISNIPTEGSLAEIGVFQGGTSKLMRLLHPIRELYCYDTFCGIQRSNPDQDYHKNGEMSCPLDDVKSFVGIENTHYRIGIFPDSFTESNVKFAFVHSDTDTYFGTKATLDIIYPLLVSGGILMFDDYNWDKCPGVKKAIEEWSIGKQLNTRIYPHQYTIIK